MTPIWQTEIAQLPAIMRRDVQLGFEHLLEACSAEQRARY